MSLYISHPSIPAAKINAYPKRRRKPRDVILFPDPTPPPVSFPVDICYQDFFTPELAQMAYSA